MGRIQALSRLTEKMVTLEFILSCAGGFASLTISAHSNEKAHEWDMQQLRVMRPAFGGMLAISFAWTSSKWACRMKYRKATHSLRLDPSSPGQVSAMELLWHPALTVSAPPTLLSNPYMPISFTIYTPRV